MGRVLARGAMARASRGEAAARSRHLRGSRSCVQSWFDAGGAELIVHVVIPEHAHWPGPLFERVHVGVEIVHLLLRQLVEQGAVRGELVGDFDFHFVERSRHGTSRSHR